MRRKHLVLVVDDDADLRRVLRWSLESLGYEVGEVADGTAALSAVRTLRPDAVLMDVVMPDTGGLEVLAQMRRQPDLVDIPVLFLSAVTDLSTKAAGFDLGAQDYIVKSADLREVDMRLRAAILTAHRREKLEEAARRLLDERDRLADETLHDPLTGLWNRRTLDDRGRRLIERHVILDQPAAVLMADIDHFKPVNDRLGHPAGDRVLKAVARFLKASLREQDLCVRYGGEEFVVILPGADKAAGQQVAERLRRGVRRLRTRISGETVPVTVSIGVAACPDDGESLDSLLTIADARLYLAKQAGRDRVIATE